MAFFRHVARRFIAFSTDRRAAIAPTFAMLLLPMLGLMGFGIDVASMLAVKTRAQNIADAGALELVRGIQVAMQKSGNTASVYNSVAAAAQTTAKSYMQSAINADSILLSATGVPTLSSTYAAATYTISTQATVAVTYKTVFMGLFGYSSVPIQVTSTASAALPKYLDFYLMLDMSGSMGLPSTELEQARLAAVNPDFKAQYPGGCVFACHFSGYAGFALSRNGGNWSNPQVSSCPKDGTASCIQLRTDAVGMAIQQLLQTATTTETATDQYRIGLYPFIDNLEAYFPITANISATGPSSLAYAAGNITNLLDTGADPTLGSGGTHFENAFPTMNSLITSVGTGTQTSPLPFVFLITDGSQDYQYQWGGSWWGSNQATTVDPSVCTQLKNRGITIAVLYIPYQVIQNPTDFSGGEDYAANANIPKIPGALTSCATAGFFFTANTPADITNALNAMFNQAIASTRLTQ